MKSFFLLIGACFFVLSLCPPVQAQDEDAEKDSGPMVMDFWGNMVSAVPGYTTWAPMMMHIAIRETALSRSEEESGLYKDTMFPLYCGYVQFFDDYTLEFVNRSGMPLERVTSFFEDIMRYKGISVPLHKEPGHAPGFMSMEYPQFFIYFKRRMWLRGISDVKQFSGDIGKDFVPVFKHQYPYGKSPRGEKDYFDLENLIPVPTTPSF